MQLQLGEFTVVETKFEPLQKAQLVVIELGKGVHINCLIPFEHTLKRGDKVPLYIDVPLALARVP